MEETHDINFDWCRPQNGQRHSPAEVREWYAGLDVLATDAQDAEITFVACKAAASSAYGG